MFLLEKEMIPVLKSKLSKLYNTDYFVEEFSSGIGIADLVFTTEIQERKEILNDYEVMHYINSFFSRKNKRIYIDALIEEKSLKKDKVIATVNFLRKLDLVVDNDRGYLKLIEHFKPAIKEIYSIEAKLHDWKSGFHQALRYRNYSHKTFLAISEANINKVNLELLKEHKVGLISVNPSAIDIIYNPRKTSPFNKTAHYHLSENFISKFNSKKI